MNEIFSNKYFLFLCRIVIGFIFIYAGIEKVIDPAGFADSIINYKLFRGVFVNITAITIPWIEVVTGILIIFGITVKENAAIIGSLLLLFTILVFISMMRGLSIDCGCFGSGNAHQVGINKIVENILMLFVCVPLIFFGSDFLSLTRIEPPGIEPQRRRDAEG